MTALRMARVRGEVAVCRSVHEALGIQGPGYPRDRGAGNPIDSITHCITLWAECMYIILHVLGLSL
jgi:hypothetical protein